MSVTILKGKVRLDPVRFFTLRPPCNWGGGEGALPYVTETHGIDGSLGTLFRSPGGLALE